MPDLYNIPQYTKLYSNERSSYGLYKYVTTYSKRYDASNG